MAIGNVRFAVLSAKPWKTNAVARLLLSVFVCIFAGSILVSLIQYLGGGGKTNPAIIYGLVAVAFVCVGVTLFLLNTSWEFATPSRLLALLLFFYVALATGAYVQKLAGPAGTSVAQMIIAALSFQGAVMILVSHFLREHEIGWEEAFGFPNRWPHAVFVGTLLACLFLPVGWGLQQASALVVTHLPRLHVRPEEQQAVQVLRVAASSGSRISLGVITILLAPLAEELLFRGILYTWVKRLGFPRLALWGTAVVFAAIHLNLVVFVPLLVLAVVLTVLYERTNNLLAPIAAHSLFNALNFAMLYVIEKRGG